MIFKVIQCLWTLIKKISQYYQDSFYKGYSYGREWLLLTSNTKVVNRTQHNRLAIEEHCADIAITFLIYISLFVFNFLFFFCHTVIVSVCTSVCRKTSNSKEKLTYSLFYKTAWNTLFIVQTLLEELTMNHICIMPAFWPLCYASKHEQ